jgi:hypothetical protein
MMVLQNYTNSENILVGPHGETYPACHDPNEAMNIKAEESSDAAEEEDPLSITTLEIKAEPEVSCIPSVCPLLSRYHKYAEMPIVFLISIFVCTHETTPLCS